nr:heparan-alpha-glucosaminide N-acetyltransferase domain-containing protein [Candidatus Sigynarchaeota archaeon]
MTQIPTRFKSLDFMKGLALVFILFVHFGLWWGNDTWASLWAFSVIFCFRIFGPVNFIFTSIFGVILSLNLRQKKEPGKSELHRLLKRTFMFLVIGTIINTINLWREVVEPTVFAGFKVLRIVFTWNIFTFLAIAQVIIFFFRRLKKPVQVAITAGVFIFYYIAIPIFTGILDRRFIDYQHGDIFMVDVLTGSILVYFLLFFENSMAPFIPYIAVAFLVNIVYSDYLAMLAEPDPDLGRIKRSMKRILVISFVAVGVGILMGFPLSPGFLNQVDYIRLTNNDAFRIWDPSLGGFPLFLHANNPAFIMFAFGIVSIIAITGIWKIDMVQRKSKLVDVLAVFGAYSLTAFITHSIASIFPLSLDLLPYLALIVPLIVVIVGIFYAWDKKLKGIFSLEWLLKWYMNNNVTALLKQQMAKNKGPGDEITRE